MKAVECAGLVHIYKTADVEVFALQGLDMTLDDGEVVAIVGASGSGKTTLMNVLAGVQTPSAGQARVAGWDLASLSGGARDAYRRDVIGYVWQSAALNLTPELTADENLQLPMLAAGKSRADRRSRANELIESFGLVMVTHDHEVEHHVDRILRIRDGRTSTETTAGAGELLILDPAGRLQLPRSVLDAARLGARVRVRAEGGRVIIEPPEDE